MNEELDEVMSFELERERRRELRSRFGDGAQITAVVTMTDGKNTDQQTVVLEWPFLNVAPYQADVTDFCTCLDALELREPDLCEAFRANGWYWNLNAYCQAGGRKRRRHWGPFIEEYYGVDFSSIAAQMDEWQATLRRIVVKEKIAGLLELIAG